MRRSIVILIIFALMLPLCACGKAPLPSPEETNIITEPSLATTETTARELTIEEKAAMEISNMTIEEKIGQMLIITYPECTADEDLLNLISTVKPGGFILMSENISSFDNTKNFVDTLQLYSEIPMIISIDQEGGIVQRLSEMTDPAPTKIPAMKLLGTTGDEALAYDVGQIMAEEMRTVGINLTYAPVADILTQQGNTVIGSRSFGTDAQTVSRMAVAIAAGLEENGVTATYKHFPGHGDTTTDSHTDLPVISKTKEELYENELIPFRNAIEHNTEVIMVGHIALPEITSNNTPASLSKEIITDLLKTEMGFSGLVVTDALNMGALTNTYTPDEIYIKAIEAGANLLLMPSDPQSAIDTIKANVDERLIDEAVKKILVFKHKHLYSYTTLDKSYLGSDEHQAVIERIEAAG